MAVGEQAPLLGIIGGMSWQSTAEYYRILNCEEARRRGGLHSANLLVRSVDFQLMADLQAADEWTRIGRLLGREARRLETAGADLLLLATNTMHRVFDALEREVSVPLLHIVDPTARALVAAQRRRPILLGTVHTMRSQFWGDRLKERGKLELVVPNPEEMTVINRVIYDELCRGTVRDESRHRVSSIVDRLVESDGGDAVILGCTELCLLLDAADVAAPLFDTTSLHAHAALDAVDVPVRPDSPDADG